MARRLAVNLKVYRHSSDEQYMDCGRACAQMVIAALSLRALVPDPANLDVVTSSAQVKPSQRELADAELSPDGPAGWYTHPDELVELLRGHSQLDWRVAAHLAGSTKDSRAQALDAIVSAIADGLKRDMPAILSLYDSDHWVVVSQAFEDEGGTVGLIQYVDPSGGTIYDGVSVPKGDDHTYRDLCHTGGSQDGDEDYWYLCTPAQLAAEGDHLEINALSPDGFTNYKGQYVAIVYRPPLWERIVNWVTELPARARALARTRTASAPDAVLPHVAPGDRERAVLTALGATATRFGLQPLKTLLQSGPGVAVREVHDIEGSRERYVVASLWDDHANRGLVGVFNADTCQVSRFRLTGHRATCRSLASAPPILWWTRRRHVDPEPPFYPFLQDGAVYRRLINGAKLEYLR